MQLIAGSLSPDSGRIVKDSSVSWPVGFGGSFHGDLTGAQNVRFIARIYGVDTDELEYFVRDFAEIGEHFDMPVRGYSSGMKSRLAFGASMGVQFDTYLIDEVTAVGDAAFRAKSKAIIQERLESSGAIMVSHSMRQLREICTSGLVLERGQISYYADINDAIAAHETNLRRNAGAGSRDGKSGKAAR